MARPQKTGLDYFPFNVDLFDDEKVIPISSEFGAKGECVVVRVLCAIYRNSYFAECSDAFKFKIAKQANVPQSLVSEVISGLVKWGFFNKPVFDSFGIITSAGIQKRWKEAVRKRVNKEELEYWIIDEKPVSGGRNPEKEEFPAEETPLNQSESTQKKRKESKVKDYRDNSKELPLSGTERPHPENIDYRKFVTWFNEKTNGVFGELRYPLSETRKSMMRARIKEHGKDAFFDVILSSAKSNFLKGDNKRSWRATFDWMIKPTNFEKILTGNFDNKESGASLDESEFINKLISQD
jgi:hypothetical protein